MIKNINQSQDIEQKHFSTKCGLPLDIGWQSCYYTAKSARTDFIILISLILTYARLNSPTNTNFKKPH